MKIDIQRVGIFCQIVVFLLFFQSGFSQVGIGTTNPDANAILDITSTVTAPGGLLLPRVALTATTNSFPLTGVVEAGMTVYNTATVADVTPGYYYHNGTVWVRIAAASIPSNDWTLLGNSGTNAATNFLGTIDNIALKLRTNNLNRFEISDGTTQANGGRLRAFTNGDATTPIYSWDANQGSGMFQAGANLLGFSTNGAERVRINANGNVGIGTSPNADALLDLNATSANRGLLLPKVALTSTTAASPLATHVDGMTVYNTATAGTAPNNVTPGYYYNDGGKWVRIAANSDASNDWKITGNAGTNAGTNFIGTTDNVSFQLRTNAVERMRILASGEIAINRTTAIANTRLTVAETGGNRAIYGNSVTGEGIRGESNGGDGVLGLVTTGRGVYGQTNNGLGVSGRATLANGQGGNFVNLTPNGLGLLALGGGNISYAFANSGTGAATTGRLFGSTSFSSTADGIGVVGVGDNLGGIPARPLGIGVLGYGFETGVFGDSGYFSQIGVQGRAEGIDIFAGVGVLGENLTGPGFGLVGESSNIGVYGTGAYGGIFESGINNGYTEIRNTAGSGPNRIGLLVAGQNLGLTGLANTGAVFTGNLRGGAGFANNNNGTGLVGVGNNINTANLAENGSGVAGTGSNLGVYGKATQGADGVGVVGLGNNGSTYFVPIDGAGVAGTGLKVGVYGNATDPSGFGVYSLGDLHTQGNITASGNLSVQGNLTATGTKNFIIDDPRDPSNKYLKHASIESNEILNLYRGVSTFNASGEVTIELPDYYEAINKNASYQLTPIGAAMPNLYVADEVNNGVFRIAGGLPFKKVSWIITAERNDAYVRNNPEIRNMTVDKGAYRGRYLSPEAYGQPLEKGILSNQEDKTRGTQNTIVAKKIIISKEMQSETEEANKLNPEQENNLTAPLKTKRTKNTREKILRNSNILKAQQTEASLKTMEQETQNIQEDEVKS